MATTEEPPITGYGRMKRKEDPRFVRGQGRYIDDLKLPGMLHGAILRSPLAHAKIVSIDASAAQAHPKVKAVVTGADLAGLNLAWMPTMSYDTQAVLATDKVRFQGQEVAFVVAEDRYAARDALELIEVDYEELPVVIDARRALDSDAPGPLPFSSLPEPAVPRVARVGPRGQVALAQQQLDVQAVALLDQKVGPAAFD